MNLLTATPEDLLLARHAVELITERGFHRDRDLRSAWAEMMTIHDLA
jgi:hypothetical protein